MGPKKDSEDGVTWSNENTISLCDVCINYITNNGRGQLIRWRDIEEMFVEKVGKHCPSKSLKNKYDSMKKDWRLWKFLKTGETGLGWNPTTGKLDCSYEWWERKLKEKPDAKKYRHKGVCPQVEEKWDQLFGDAVATGAGCVAPSANPGFVDKPVNDVEENENVNGLAEEAFREYSQYSGADNLDDQEGSFWHNFAKEVTGKPTNSDVPKNKTKSVKRRKRESGGTSLMREHIEKVHDIHHEIVDLIKQGTNNKKDDIGTSIRMVIDIMNRIAANDDLVVGGEIWCHAMHMFRDRDNRDIFFEQPSDDARLAWLKFSQSRNLT